MNVNVKIDLSKMLQSLTGSPQQPEPQPNQPIQSSQPAPDQPTQPEPAVPMSPPDPIITAGFKTTMKLESDWNAMMKALA